MIPKVSSGQFDVVIAAGPKVQHWPSIGVKTLGRLCSDAGLKVGIYGGEGLVVRGVLPGMGTTLTKGIAFGTGAIVIVEDIQGRVHRISARAVIKLRQNHIYPMPFSGWQSQGLMPITTAKYLLKNSELINWSPAVAILGSGNRALGIACRFLEDGVATVYCIESFAKWGMKHFSGWEIEMRKFKLMGGTFVEGNPLDLRPGGQLSWNLSVETHEGKKEFNVSRVISAGPFGHALGLCEYPPSSLLFELEQTSSSHREDDLEGWNLELERGRYLGLKIIQSLVHEVSRNRRKVVQGVKRSRLRLKRFSSHQKFPFLPKFDGKWLHPKDRKFIQEFGGTPKLKLESQKVASIECFEDVGCDICQQSCPEGAIKIQKKDLKAILDGEPPLVSQIKFLPELTESLCTGCGKCLQVCPSNAIVMLHSPCLAPKSNITLKRRGRFSQGELIELLNRNGENLGMGRIQLISNVSDVDDAKVLDVQVPNHLLWEARGLRKMVSSSQSKDEDLKWAQFYEAQSKKIEILLNGEKKWVREGIPISVALFEMNQERLEDRELCPDGSCHLCEVSVDGTKRLACQAKTRKGVSLISTKNIGLSPSESTLCVCLGISAEEIKERVVSGKLVSAEAVLSMTHVGNGKCRGQICSGTFKQLLVDLGLDINRWVDWRFPWSEWWLKHS